MLMGSVPPVRVLFPCSHVGHLALPGGTHSYVVVAGSSETGSSGVD